jgi:hypothetical protein
MLADGDLLAITDSSVVLRQRVVVATKRGERGLQLRHLISGKSGRSEETPK